MIRVERGRTEKKGKRKGGKELKKKKKGKEKK